MGNCSSTDSLVSCLLNKQEFMALRVGSHLDHRDYEGRFLLAKVLQKSRTSRTKIYIHYVDWDRKFNKWVDYSESPFDFAKAKSISRRAANGPLQHHRMHHHVAFRPNPKDSKCKWRFAQITETDPDSGQVCVTYTCSHSGKTVERYVHLDNRFEIDFYDRLTTQQTNSCNSNKNDKSNNNSHKNNAQLQKNNNHKHGNNRNNSGSHCDNHHSHTHDTYDYNQNQCKKQRQVQVQRQDQMTVRTQLLLDDTEKVLRLTRNYLDAAAQAKCSKQEISTYNQKVVVGLTCFRMKVGGMRKNAKAEGIEFDDAFKSSSMIIKKFDRELRQEYGGKQFLMQRLDPCLNYMQAVLKGDVHVPPLPYVNEYDFNANVASSVISSVTHAQNHAIPQRVKEISKHNEQFKSRQNELREEYEAEQTSMDEEKENGGAQKAKPIDYRHLTQDFNTENIAFADSKAKQHQRNQQQQNAFKHQQPDLMNGDGQQADYEMDVLPPCNTEGPTDVEMGGNEDQYDGWLDKYYY